MNSKIFSLILALPLLFIDTGYSFAGSINLEMFDIQIPNLIGENAVLTPYLNQPQPLVLLARGGYRPKCSRTGTGCR